MLINLLPDFLAVLNAADRESAYYDYFARHQALLSAYWNNYVVEPSGPHFEEVVRSTVRARRDDLFDLMSRVDVVTLAQQTERAVAALLHLDAPCDVVLMVGVGAANAGELVVDGRGVAFVCLEHFTGVTDPYEPPSSPEVTVCSDSDSVEHSTERIVSYLRERDFVA